MASKKHAIVMLAYFNCDLVERTLESFGNYRKNTSVDVFLIENPSKNSASMREIAVKYNVAGHYMCSENVGVSLFDEFLRLRRAQMTDYDFISITESDVVVEDGAIEETLSILQENAKIPIAQIQINVDLDKYRKLLLGNEWWVPAPIRYKTFFLGTTGFQFVTFRKEVMYDLLDRLERKEISGSIAGMAGAPGTYAALSDQTVRMYVHQHHGGQVLQHQPAGEGPQAVTNLKLEHIGWEKYMDSEGNFDLQGEYAVEKIKHPLRHSIPCAIVEVTDVL